MDKAPIRVRFAPSPTGLLHVGNARTALYNWLFVRRAGGQLILRIEDTDADRSEARYETQLMEDLRWLGLDWDEGPGEAAEKGVKPKDTGSNGPYRQSDRLAIYAKLAKKLLDDDKAYRCFCTVAELEEERRVAAASGQPQVYSGRCRKLTTRAIRKYLEAGRPYTIRLRPIEQPLQFRDLVRGAVRFSAEEVNDLILVRSGHASAPGVPVYNFVVAVDDAAMGITHVIREDDHLSNTPKQVAVYHAFGWKVPEFAHLAPILGADRERISKRHGATAITSFREMGYLPEALANHLALLGWSHADGKPTAFTLQGLVKAFSLDRVKPEPSVFDYAQLDALNRHFIKSASPARLARLAWEYFGFLLPSKEDASDDILVWFASLVQLFASSVDHLDQLPAKTLFMWGFNPHEIRTKAGNVEVLAADSARAVLAHFADRVRTNYMPITGELVLEWLEEIKEATGIKGPELLHPIRIALTGTQSGPEFDRLIPLIEQGAMLGIGVPSVRMRIEQFVG